MTELPDSLVFEGSYTFDRERGEDGLLFDREVCEKPGVYMWVLPYRDGFVANYVGKARSATIGDRQESHLWDLLGSHGHGAQRREVEDRAS